MAQNSRSKYLIIKPVRPTQQVDVPSSQEHIMIAQYLIVSVAAGAHSEGGYDRGGF